MNPHWQGNQTFLYNLRLESCRYLPNFGIINMVKPYKFKIDETRPRKLKLSRDSNHKGKVKKENQAEPL